MTSRLLLPVRLARGVP